MQVFASLPVAVTSHIITCEAYYSLLFLHLILVQGLIVRPRQHKKTQHS